MDDRGVITRALDASVTTEISGIIASGCSPLEITVHKDVDRFLAALEASGWVIVPVEATAEMLMAGIVERHDQLTPEAWNKATANIYRAMIAASKGQTDGP